MSQVTIQTNKKHRANKGFIIAGKDVKFDEFCMSEVPERYVESILESDPSVSIVDEDEARKFAKAKKENKKNDTPDIDIIDENNRLKVMVSKLEERKEELEEKVKELQELLDSPAETESVETEEEEKVEEKSEEDGDVDLSKMKKDELQALCGKLELEKEEWEELNKANLIKYIESKLEETNE